MMRCHLETVVEVIGSGVEGSEKPKAMHGRRRPPPLLALPAMVALLFAVMDADFQPQRLGGYHSQGTPRRGGPQAVAGGLRSFGGGLRGAFMGRGNVLGGRGRGGGFGGNMAMRTKTTSGES